MYMSQQNYIIAGHLSAISADLMDAVEGLRDTQEPMAVEDNAVTIETLAGKLGKLAEGLRRGTPIPDSSGTIGERPEGQIVTPDHPGTGEAHSSSAQSGVSPGGGGLTPTGGSFENGPSYHAPASQIERGPGNRPVFRTGEARPAFPRSAVEEAQPTGGGSGESVPSEVSAPESPTSTSEGQRKSDGVVVSDKPEREFPPVPPIPDPDSNTGGQTI